MRSTIDATLTQIARRLVGLGCRGVLRLHRSDRERDLAVLGVHQHRIALLELALEQVLGERVLDQALEGALERAGAERRIPALLDDDVLGRATLGTRTAKG